MLQTNNLKKTVTQLCITSNLRLH